MPDYQQLTTDELLNIAQQRKHLTDEARSLLDSELVRRNISALEIQTFARRLQANERAEERKRTRLINSYQNRNKQFLGKKNFRRDPRKRIDEFDTTLWFIVAIPIFPISSHRIRRHSRRWWNLCPSDTIHILKTKPRDWQQILMTWCKTAAVLLAIAVVAIADGYWR